jgi:CubicO group peptidase (beta-lactamase class C family)
VIDVKAVSALVEEALKAFEVPGAAVALVKDDRVVYLKGHGVLEIGGDKAVTPDTLFAIASVTKAFTATAVGLLVDGGKMAWDDPVRQHLDYFRLADPLASEQATLRDLLCHRTGLGGHAELHYDTPWGREEIIRRIGRVQLSKSFRSTWQYQNIMYAAAGQAVAATAKSSWEDVVQKHLFAPLGMTRANFSITAAQQDADHATPHAKDRAGKVISIPWRNMENIGPAGSINASAADMARWVRFQLGDGTFEGKRLLSEAQLRETHTPQILIHSQEMADAFPHSSFLSYGLGWGILDYGAHVVVCHGGGIDGFMAEVFLVPKTKLGGVILTNSESPMRDALKYSLLDQQLGLPRKDWNAHFLAQAKKAEAKQKTLDEQREQKRHQGTKPSRQLDAYTGTYEEPAYGQVVLSLKDEALQLQWNRCERPLNHYHYDTFLTDQNPSPSSIRFLDAIEVMFTLRADGEVATLRLFDVDFKKVKTKPARDS